MNRFELQRLADERIQDAQALLTAQRWSAAYYLAGYAVECGLKSSVLRYIMDTGAIFQDRKYAEKCWTHDLEVLVQLAGLERKRGLDISADPALGAHWLLVKDWTETSRYQIISQPQAENFFEAVSHPVHGVLQWIKRYW